MAQITKQRKTLVPFPREALTSVPSFAPIAGRAKLAAVLVASPSVTMVAALVLLTLDLGVIVSANSTLLVVAPTIKPEHTLIESGSTVPPETKTELSPSAPKATLQKAAKIMGKLQSSIPDGLKMPIKGKEKQQAMSSFRSRLQSSVPSYLEQMQNMLDMAENIQQQLKPVDEPKNWQSIREAVAKISDVISKYQTHGLSNMPNLPAFPGLDTVLRTPDKVLRVELSMLQHLVLMAESMMANPIVATVNLPKDLATMLSRMAAQIEQ